MAVNEHTPVFGETVHVAYFRSGRVSVKSLFGGQRGPRLQIGEGSGERFVLGNRREGG